ncbi:RelA/SpoT domain-containing protein [Methylophilus sp. VKM B-3414]|uniref:RelA/SpoT domain-containing protein n=1 Tax=Methylophilus sp. VKM B-3414 TaxID=3076121 RepID=UPI0028C6425F|nr:RelA/SpoT domain-containing protein [Methylophilus sp. VKM B-3414]MDT7850178.1 RelA/SpoT domain-containing protein [Methylophilus sp. VKM B-3414]
MSDDLVNCLQKYKDNRHLFERFQNGVVDFFRLDPSFIINGANVIHTIKARLKDEDHLREKINRKCSEDMPITAENILTKITDLAGVRILHLYQDQFPIIHQRIMGQISSKEWALHEPPKAYSWDPEATDFFKNLGLTPEIKETFYTSIHYVVKPKEDSEIICEIQVRTLFEEIWGEIDHSLNYPKPTENIACKEQLRVLSKLVSTGTRLADSIFRTSSTKL